MTDSRANIVIPYVRFLVRSGAAELTRRDRPPTIDAEMVPVGRDASEPTVEKPPYGSVVDVLEKGPPRRSNGDHDEAQTSHRILDGRC
jgi:hypothetical protein